MRAKANDRLKSLLKKVARLEKGAGPGAAVEILLSDRKDRYGRRKWDSLDTEITSKFSLDMDWHEIKKVKGHAKVVGVTLASYYNTKDVQTTVGVIKGDSFDFEDNISERILDFLLDEEVLKKPKILNTHVTIQGLEDELVGGGFTRGKAPEEIEVKGEAIIFIEFRTQDGRNLEFYESEIEFTAIMETTVPFRDAFDRLDEVDEDGDEDSY